MSYSKFLWQFHPLQAVLTFVVFLAHSSVHAQSYQSEIDEYLRSNTSQARPFVATPAPPIAPPGLRIATPAGDEHETDQYYSRLTQILDFDVQSSTLNDLIGYLGYSELVEGGKGTDKIYTGLLAEDLEGLEPFVLMPRSSEEFEILKALAVDGKGLDELLSLRDFSNDSVLVSRFFAPKIATYFRSDDPNIAISPGEITPGWRKLARLEARTNSRAEKAGIARMYLLFNVVEPDPNADPYDNVSKNNQVILVPRERGDGDNAYFFVYFEKDLGYPIGKFLAANFDLPGHTAKQISGAEDGKYFVPRSCAQCHGHSDSANGTRLGNPIDPTLGFGTDDFSIGIYPFVKPNYLDTDQWYDWMDYDYPQIVASNHDVVFDGGKDHASSNYKRAFNVIRKLNQGILAESVAAEKNSASPSFQSEAVSKWLALHVTSDDRIDIGSRSIGSESWDTTDPLQFELLSKLNNHCFRCHSSLIYSVFDKEQVRRKAGAINALLNAQYTDVDGNTLPGRIMPQGRVLSDAEREELIEMIDKLFLQN